MPTVMTPRGITVYPDRGPVAGGTNLTINHISGICEIDAVVLKISPEIYKLCRILYRGGTRLTVLGTSMDAVVNSSIKYQVTNCSAVTFTESCEVHSARMLICRTPNVSICKQFEVLLDDATLHMTIVGFIFDGYTKYNNISELCSLPHKLSVYDPPVLQHRNSTAQYKKGALLEIKGEHLNRGVTVRDYRVFVGAGICDIDEESFSASALFCLPPKPIPKKMDSSHGKYHSITVKIGNYAFIIGEMSYPWWFNGAVIIPAVFIAVLIIICLVMTPILIRTYRNRHRQITVTNYIALPQPVFTMNNYFENYEIEMNRHTIDDLYSDGSYTNYHTLNTSSLKYYEPGQATEEFFQEFFTKPKGRENDYRSKYGKRWSEHFDSLYKSVGKNTTDNDIECERQTAQPESWQWFVDDGREDVAGKGPHLHPWTLERPKPGYSTDIHDHDLLTGALENREEEPFYVNLPINRNEQNIEEPVYINIAHNRTEHHPYGDLERTGSDYRPGLVDILEEMKYQQKEDQPSYGNAEQNRGDRQNVGEPFHIDIPAERIHDQREDAYFGIWENVHSADLERLVSAHPHRLPRISVGEDDIREVNIDFDVPGVVYVSEHHHLTTIPSFKKAVKSRPSYSDNYRNNNVQ